MFLKIGVLKSFAIFTGKHLCWSLLFNKVAGLRPAVLLKKKRLQHRCFLANMEKFLRTAFFKEQLRWLLLKVNNSFDIYVMYCFQSFLKCFFLFSRSIQFSKYYHVVIRYICYEMYLY